MHTAAVIPWYRQKWPWLLMAPPLVAVLGGIAMIVVALRSYDGVVADDYYKRGLEINAEVSRTDRAAELGIGGTVSIDADGETVTVKVSSAQPLPPEAVLRLRLVHPGRAEADRTAVLARRSLTPDSRSAVFVGPFEEALDLQRPVAWRAVVETVQWRIDTAVDAGALTNFDLRPAL